MNISKPDLARMGDLVYVKPIAVASLPEALREQAGTLQTDAVARGADGAPTALGAARARAFVRARQHDKVPMTVH